MRLLKRFLNGHTPEEHWRERALQMALDRGEMQPLGTIVEHAEAYLEFIQTGKAKP